MSASNEIWKPLGRYIKEVVLRVGTDTSISISGVNIQKGFIPTVANMTGVDTSKYKLVPFNHFACNFMHIGRDVTIPIAYNNTENRIAVSPAYYVFTIKEEMANEILPLYLEMILTRDEFGRLSWFHTDGSIRGNLPENTFREILIPVPDIKVQQELVDTYNGLKALAEQNEALIEPLSKACEAFIVDCKSKYPQVELGEYIVPCDERNSNNSYDENHLRGVTNEGIFDFSKANTIGLNFSNYKIVRKGSFAYNPARINIGSIAYNIDNDCIISPMYCAFTIRNDARNRLNPMYLNLWFRRKEFQRSTLFYATGSVRDIFDYGLMEEVKIPLPPIEVQQSIVNLYNCLEEAKKIASEARERLKSLCPALVQRAANS